MRKRFSILVILTLFITLYISNTLYSKKQQTINKNIYSYESIGKKKYKGLILNILTHEKPVMGEPTVLHARQFEKLTGIKINVFHVPFHKLYQETLSGLKNNKYDIVFYGSLWIADIYQYLEPVPDKMLKSSQFKDILPHYKDIAKWGNISYQVNIDGDRHYLQYRKDLFEDIKNQNIFKNKYGKKLSPPKTWKDLNLIAGFFNKRIIKKNKKIFGIAEITNKNDLLFSQFIKRAAPYAKHPKIKGGFYFDIKTMKPLINTPGFVEALKDFIKSQNFYPPGGNKFTLANVIMSFGTGNTVFSDCWDDSFVKAMEKNSKISDKIASSLSPGSHKVWNRKTVKWDSFPAVNYVPYLAWGWTSGVNKKSKNIEAAFDYLGFFSNNKNHLSDMKIGRFGVNPFRQSDLKVNFWIKEAGWNRNAAKSYIKTLKKLSILKNHVLDLRIHQGRQYMQVLSIGVFRALSKREPPQEALDEVARRWEIITERVGRDKQRKAYAHIVKFEDGE